MKKFSIKYSVSYAFMLICLLHCKNPAREDSMQPYAGYPLLANPDSIKQELAWELFYSFEVKSNIFLSTDYQFLINPGYNKDRGLVNVFSVRLHAII